MSERNLDNSMIYRQSQVEEAGTTYLLARMKGKKVLAVEGDGAGFEGSPMGNWLVCPLSSGNAATLRQRLAWLHPQPLGLVRSAGCGDRLGLATPGHIRAVRKVEVQPYCQAISSTCSQVVPKGIDWAASAIWSSWYCLRQGQ